MSTPSPTFINIPPFGYIRKSRILAFRIDEGTAIPLDSCNTLIVNVHGEHSDYRLNYNPKDPKHVAKMTSLVAELVHC